MKQASTVVSLLAVVIIMLFCATASESAARRNRGLLAGTDDNLVILRWLWPPDSLLPPVCRVYRSEGGGGWQLLTPDGISGTRDRKEARKILGKALYEKYQGLLFPDIPDPVKNPGAYRKIGRNLQALWGMRMLVADLNPKLARVLGVRYEDHTARNGRTYRYRLDRLDRKTKKWRTVAVTGPVVPARAIIGAPPMFQGKGGDGIAMVRWKREERFSGYEVYRSEKRNGRFRKINRLPVVILKNRDKNGNIRYPEWIYADREVENGTTYWYLVRGRDPFGRLSRPTAPIALTPRDRTAPGAPRKFDAREEGDAVTLSWEKSPEKDVAGYRVYRSTNYKDGFRLLTKKLLPPDTLQYEEHGLPTGRTFWYCVTAVDRAGNESPRSYIAPANIRDVVPPAAPRHLAARTEPGRFLLRWQAGTEKDLAGYRVYMAPDREEKYYHLLTRDPVPETSYVFEIPKTLSGSPLYFKITAMDRAGNESGFSAIVAARLPDVTPPRPPVLKSVRRGENMITISWFPGSEKDVAGYFLYRYTRGKDRKSAICLNGKEAIPASTDSFTDRSDLEPGRKYLYFLTAIDRSGNVSAPSRELVGAVFDRTPPGTPELIRAVYDPQRKGVVLAWKKSPARDLAGVVLYRSTRKKDGFRPVSGLVRTTSFVDSTADPGRTYYYRALAFDRVRNRSGYSGVVTYRPR